jgi:hypothetical protein
MNETKSTIKLILKIIIAVIIIAGIILIFKKKESSVIIPLPSTLQIPLFQNKKTVKVEKNSFDQQEVMFYSSVSADSILTFYKEWASSNKFVLVQNKSEESASNNSERITFSLVPGFGVAGLSIYYFVLEPKENETRVIISYSEIRAFQKKPENNIQQPNIPKDFKIKL